jgi:hypothetical protein
MPRDGFPTQVDPTEARFRAKHDEMFEQWTAATNREARAKEAAAEHNRIAEISAAEAAEIVAKATKLREAALMLGIDLMADGPTQDQEMMSEEPVPGFSIKQYVLEQARLAYPGSIKAATIRELVRQLGYDIHDKTIGMSLYRWSQKGALQRIGKADWYYIPVAQRAPGSVQDGHDDVA